MSAHTPGPWKVRDYKTDDGDLWIDCDNWTGPKRRGGPTLLGGTLATAHANGTGKGGVEANARLIAAAPDLLAALEATRPIIKARLEMAASRGLANEEAKLLAVLVDLDAAIAKARGK